MKTTFLSFSLILIFAFSSYGQDYKATLSELYSKASVVAEVRVGENSSHPCSLDSRRRPSIYTRHETLVLSLIKSDVEDLDLNDLTILTKGGIYQGIEHSITHSVQVTEGGQYLVFLTLPPQSYCPQKNDFVISSPSARVATDITLIENGINILQNKVHIPRYGYSDKEEFFRTMSDISGKEISPQRRGTILEKSIQPECLEFFFTISAPDLTNPLVHDVKVSVKTTGTSKYISNPVFAVKYDSDFMGDSAAYNQKITLEDIGISSLVNYEKS